jgi:signal transduction histidine kinase
MHERAEAIGATLDIESKPGQGTQVVVVWQAARSDDLGKE